MANRSQQQRRMAVSGATVLGGVLLLLGQPVAAKSAPSAVGGGASKALTVPIFVGSVMRDGRSDKAARAVLKKTLRQMGEEDSSSRGLVAVAECVDPLCARSLREQGGYLLLAQIKSTPLGVDESRMWLIDVKTERVLIQDTQCTGCGELASLSRQTMALVERLAAPDWGSLQDGSAAPPLGQSLESGHADRAGRVPVQLRVNAAPSLSKLAASLASAVKHQALNMGYLPKEAAASTSGDDASAQLQLDLIRDDKAPRDSQLSEVVLSLSDSSGAQQTVLNCVTIDCKSPAFTQVVQRAAAVLLDESEGNGDHRSGHVAGVVEAPATAAPVSQLMPLPSFPAPATTPPAGSEAPRDHNAVRRQRQLGVALAVLSVGSFITAGVLGALNGTWAGGTAACSTADAGVTPVVNAKGHCGLWTVPAYGTLAAVGGVLAIADIVVWTWPWGRKPAPATPKVTASYLPGGRS